MPTAMPASCLTPCKRQVSPLKWLSTIAILSRCLYGRHAAADNSAQAAAWQLPSQSIMSNKLCSLKRSSLCSGSNAAGEARHWALWKGDRRRLDGEKEEKRNFLFYRRRKSYSVPPASGQCCAGHWLTGLDFRHAFPKFLQKHLTEAFGFAFIIPGGISNFPCGVR